jgi:hypothetical protein
MIEDFLVNLLASLAYDLLKALPSRFRGNAAMTSSATCAPNWPARRKRWRR